LIGTVIGTVMGTVIGTVMGTVISAVSISTVWVGAIAAPLPIVAVLVGNRRNPAPGYVAVGALAAVPTAAVLVLVALCLVRVGAAAGAPALTVRRLPLLLRRLLLARPGLERVVRLGPPRGARLLGRARLAVAGGFRALPLLLRILTRGLRLRRSGTVVRELRAVWSVGHDLEAPKAC
jgi:hypothetical protein